MKLFCLPLTLLIPCFYNAQDAHAFDVVMSISPESCIVENGWCNSDLEINWQLTKAKAVCLKIEGRSDKICFEKQINNTTVIQVNAKRPIRIQLVSAANNRVIADAILNVFVKEYKKRSRQRHAWSVIQ